MATSAASKLLVGLDFAISKEPILLESALGLLQDLQGDFICVPLGVPQSSESSSSSQSPISSFYPRVSDITPKTSTLLSQSSEWSHLVCGKVSVSNWSSESLAIIEREMQFANYLGVAAIILPPLPTADCASFFDGHLSSGSSARCCWKNASCQEFAEQCQSLASIAKIIVKFSRLMLTYLPGHNATKLWIPTLASYTPYGPAASTVTEWMAFYWLRRLCNHYEELHYLSSVRTPTTSFLGENSKREGGGSSSCQHRSFAPLHYYKIVYPLPVLMHEVASSGSNHEKSRSSKQQDWSDWCWLGEDIPAFLCSHQVLSSILDSPLQQQRENTVVDQQKTFLSHPMGIFIQQLLKRRASLILSMANPIVEELEGCSEAGKFIVNLFEKHICHPQNDSFSSYEDLLQIPLQPLGDHLNNATYQCFEKDKVKYDLYEEAIRRRLEYLALHAEKLHDYNANVSIADSAITKGVQLHCHLTILGAGRGPLISAAIQAKSKFKNLHLTITAVEKNPFAFQDLELKKTIDPSWHGGIPDVEVELILSDGRQFHSFPSSYRCDILVSELLGSFGDNELSPECIHGFIGQQKRFYEKNKIPDNPYQLSIPLAYTSFVAPVHAVRAHSNALEHARPCLMPHTKPLAPLQSPYVTKLTKSIPLSSDHALNGNVLWGPDTNAAPCFTFLHSTTSTGATSLIGRDLEFQHTFSIHQTGVVTGLAGYFDCTLFCDDPDLISCLGKEGRPPIKRPKEEVDPHLLRMSIVPETHTPDLWSWFPLYFPLPDDQHLAVEQGDSVSVRIKRRVNSQEMWYEWSICRGEPKELDSSLVKIMNENGEASSVSFF